MSTQSQSPLDLQPRRDSRQTWLLVAGGLAVLACICGIIAMIVGGNLLTSSDETGGPATDLAPVGAGSATLTVAVSPDMAPTFDQLITNFNQQALQTPDGQTLRVEIVILDPEKMIEQALATPTFQALTPDSSLWLNQLEQRWTEQQDQSETQTETLIPIGARRTNTPVRYAVSPIVVAAWEDVGRELGWPNESVGWEQIQRKATRDPDFKWNHPSTNNASGLLATLAEFYAGAGLTRGLTEEAATDPQTLDYVRAVEATIRFYGEGEDVIVQNLIAEGRDFLDAFVAQEQTVIAWNQAGHGEQLVAIYPQEGTLWADHPLALLEPSGMESLFLTDNQRRVYQSLVQFLTGPEAQRALLARGYRPADLNIDLDAAGSPFADTESVAWQQPQTTLQIPSARVVTVVQNVWWYTKRPTNVFLVVDTSGSMEGNKLASTQEALLSFIAQMQGDRDQVGLIEFGSGVKSVEPLRTLDNGGRERLNQVITGLQARGNTALLDAVWEAYIYLLTREDTEAINAIVVMTDGIENASENTLADLGQRFQNTQTAPIVVFTIGFGQDVDVNMLENLAQIGNGQFRRADETDIKELYKIISTYF